MLVGLVACAYSNVCPLSIWLLISIVAFNRDEEMERPTSPTCIWSNRGINIVSGRDRVHGGVWLGVNEYGVFAAITNNREVPVRKSEANKSRGILALDILSNQTLTELAMTQVLHHEQDYANFNLTIGDLKSGVFTYIGSEDHDSRNGMHEIGHGQALGISNGTIHSNWPKTYYGISKFEEILGSFKNELDVDSLAVKLFLGLLMDDQVYELNSMPSNTVYGRERERLLSGIFTKPLYLSPIQDNPQFRGTFGTRSSSVIIVSNSGLCTVYEIDWASLYEEGFEWPPDSSFKDGIRQQWKKIEWQLDLS